MAPGKTSGILKEKGDGEESNGVWKYMAYWVSVREDPSPKRLYSVISTYYQWGFMNGLSSGGNLGRELILVAQRAEYKPIKAQAESR